VTYFARSADGSAVVASPFALAFRGGRWLLLMLPLFGCGDPGMTVDELGAAFDVEGIVTLDGEPLASGTLTLVPVDDQGNPVKNAPSQSGEIEDGEFLVKASYGHKRVEITSDAPGIDIPTQYNTCSELRAYVSYESEDVFQFPLQSR
jgi:hypothetical protein